jgi:adenylate cyclase class 2
MMRGADGKGGTVAHNEEIKRYCADFRPVRRVLRRIQARKVAVKRQVDTYFRVPGGGRFDRLKLREERGKRELIGYADRYADGLRSVDYQIVPVAGAVGELLAASVGVSVVVRKRRELWMLGQTRFNLDTIEGVGTVFETEVVLDAEGPSGGAEHYLTLFEPYLGERIDGSNEDLLWG